MSSIAGRSHTRAHRRSAQQRALHRIARWKEKSEDERCGVGEGYLQELTESIILFGPLENVPVWSEADISRRLHSSSLDDRGVSVENDTPFQPTPECFFALKPRAF